MFKAEKILKTVNMPLRNYYALQERIARDAPSSELLVALATADTLVARRILVAIAVIRCETAAAQIMLPWLDDESHELRAIAVDAIGKLGDPSTGSILFDHLMDRDKAKGIKGDLIAGLGAVNYRPAIPLLIELLEDPNGILRGIAAWALGVMAAEAALDPLRYALVRESDLWARDRMEEAIAALEVLQQAQNALDPAAALAILLPALAASSFTLRGVAAWGIGELGAEEARVSLEQAIRHEKYSCSTRQRMKEAHAAITLGVS